jgi:hypothetical protein
LLRPGAIALQIALHENGGVSHTMQAMQMNRA